MKWMVRSLIFVSCLLLFVQVEVAFCQDRITAFRGETTPNLQLGLQNTGLIGYEAYADPSGDAASWCVPMRILFGYVGPGETKWATYSLRIPRDVSPDTYYLFWDFYARSGSYTKNLFSSTVRITVVAATRDPVLLLPLWAVVCAAAVAPLWYWTKKEPTKRRERTKATELGIVPVPKLEERRPFWRLALATGFVVGLFLATYYVSWRLPLVPVTVMRLETRTSQTTYRVVTTLDIYVTRTITTYTTSLATRYVRDEEEVIVTSVSIQRTSVENLQTRTFAWTTELVETTISSTQTQRQTLSESWPMHWILITIPVAAALTLLILLRKQGTLAVHTS